MPIGRGGFREGAGRKPAGYIRPEQSASAADYERERAEHERIKREQREFNFARERAEYLPREAQRQAAAAALAMLCQALRAIPDNLERTLSLPPAAVEAVSVQIDAALAELAAAFRSMTLDDGSGPAARQ